MDSESPESRVGQCCCFRKLLAGFSSRSEFRIKSRLHIPGGSRGSELYTEPLKDAPVIPDYSKDWKRVAEIVDRLFFWLFLLAITLSTLVLLHPLMTLLSETTEKLPKSHAMR